MRLFTAVDISKRSRRLLDKKVSLIRDQVSQDIKWVDKEKWHLTLKFLGDTSERKLYDLQDAMMKAVEDKEKFGAVFSEIDAFPSLENPSVVYAGLESGEEELKNIYTDLENELVTAGFEPESREYIPHLTLARTRDNTDSSLLGTEIKKVIDGDFINIYTPIKEVHLYESKLLPEGPIYNKIYSFSLK